MRVLLAGCMCVCACMVLFVAAAEQVKKDDPVSLLQHVAYERNGRRLVAVFNYRAGGSADCTIRFADRGAERRFTVPAARCVVLEFEEGEY